MLLAAAGVGVALGVCSTVALTHPIDPPLKEEEKRLICEDLRGGVPSEAWSRIPDSQRRFHLRAFLQDRGYHHPTFSSDEVKTWVEPGPKTRVKDVETTGEPVGFDLRRKRGVIGEPLTPELLNEVERWSKLRLGTLGYACPKVRVRGDPSSGIVRLEIEPESVKTLLAIAEDMIPGVAPGMFRRYDAFQLGEPFNGDLLRLTENRVVADGQIENLHFKTEKCGRAEVTIRQEVVVGAPRLITVGFGVNTEGLILVRGSWKNTRLGSSASLIEASLFASSKRQTAMLSGDWYFLSYPSRKLIKPSLLLEHRNEDPFESVSVQAQIFPTTSWDGQRNGIIAHLGPSYEYIHTIRGTGPANSRFLSLDGEIRLSSHYFNYFQTEPRTGFSLDFRAIVNDQSLGSDVTVQRGELSFQSLWNYRQYDPPLWVLGTRGAIATAFTEQNELPGRGLPATFLQFLGGAEDVRGFGRQELPENGVGGLTSAFLGLEWRWAGADLPLRIQPLLFIDAGAIGADSMALDSPVYWSPGIGGRSASPIGVFRATIAHGYATGVSDPRLSHFQIYVSYGAEF